MDGWINIVVVALYVLGVSQSFVSYWSLLSGQLFTPCQLDHQSGQFSFFRICHLDQTRGGSCEVVN